MKLRVTDIMEPFLSQAFRFKIAFGGRGGTKSQTTVDILLHLVTQMGKRVCCFREFGSSIEDSIWSLISDEITRMGVPGFDVRQRRISHESGGFFKSKGLGRESKSIKSFSGFDIFLVEEGDFLTDEILKDLTPTLRKEGSELWVIFNPESRTDAVSKRFIMPYYKQLLKNKIYQDDLHYIVWTNSDENPWLPEPLRLERELDRELLTTAEWDHKWGGHFNEAVANAVIKAEWFDAAIDAHLSIPFRPEGIKVISHDPSDLGPDDKALAYRHGSVVLDVQTMGTGDSNEGMDWALDYAMDRQVDLFAWDCDGMGVSLNRQVETALSGKQIETQMYKGSEGPDNPGDIYQGDSGDKLKRKSNRETFYNKRAQFTWMLRDRFYNTFLAIKKNIWTNPDNMISISSDIKEIERLRSEVCRIPRIPNGNGKIQIMRKKDMKMESPNMFDALCMAFVSRGVSTEDTESMRFTEWA